MCFAALFYDLPSAAQVRLQLTAVMCLSILPDKIPVLQMLLKQPFQVTEREGEFDVIATVVGGGRVSGLGSKSSIIPFLPCDHGISRALTYFEPGLRPALKAGGFMTRDPRVVERKMFEYGLKAKARRSFQFSKR